MTTTKATKKGADSKTTLSRFHLAGTGLDSTKFSAGFSGSAEPQLGTPPLSGKARAELGLGAPRFVLHTNRTRTVRLDSSRYEGLRLTADP